MNKTTQFTPPVGEVMAHYNLSDDEWDCLSSFTKQKLATMYNKHAAAPAMYEALQEARDYIRQLLDSKEDEAIDNLTNNGEDVEERLNQILAQAEGRQA